MGNSIGQSVSWGEGYNVLAAYVPAYDGEVGKCWHQDDRRVREGGLQESLVPEGKECD